MFEPQCLIIPLDNTYVGAHLRRQQLFRDFDLVTTLKKCSWLTRTFTTLPCFSPHRSQNNLYHTPRLRRPKTIFLHRCTPRREVPSRKSPWLDWPLSVRRSRLFRVSHMAAPSSATPERQADGDIHRSKSRIDPGLALSTICCAQSRRIAGPGMYYADYALAIGCYTYCWPSLE